MIEILWRRHYAAGVYGGFHNDMAQAFKAMLADPDCDRKTAAKIHTSIRMHKYVESLPAFHGTKSFSIIFP